MVPGCLQRQGQPVPVQPDCPPYPTEKISGLISQNQRLKDDLATSQSENDRLQSAVTNLEIRILQQQALVNELERRVDAQQKRLDDAITEVVRTKSKLRSIESKAEAASTIAEAEIAVRSIKNRIETKQRDKLDELKKAERLLEMSMREFKAQNYGGALYLAVQSKNQVSAGGRRLREHDETARVNGEVAFDQPLTLSLTKNTNLRAGPGLSQPILMTLQQGRAIVGYAYMRSWIRVHTEDGMVGWVHQSLVRAR
jgi:hypothetical protein